MNRLWIRLSLTFTAVVIIVMITIGFTAALTVGVIDAPSAEMSVEVQEYFDQVRRDRPPFNFTTVIVIVGVVAIIAGVGLSKSLTAPLSELEKAAQAIGQRDLSRRVPAEGSQEMVAVAAAFNEMAAQLEQAETVRRNLLADVAHELRHPIHILQGNLQAILDDVYPLSKEEIARLFDQTRHLSTLVNDLHELSLAEARQLPLHKQQTDIAQLVKETAVSFKSVAAAKDVHLQVELLGTIPDLVVDAARIRQTIHNMLNNALRHTPVGGAIRVSVERQQDAVQIRVNDTGAGMSPEQLAHVFDRFYRADAARSRDQSGIGLGLAIVKAIAEAHDGAVAAASPGMGQGSVFTLSLPLI
jgi:signal transduction histidine kinase